MYIAGIHLARLTEGIATSSLFATVAATAYTSRKSMRVGNERGGPVKVMPKTLLGKIITPVHAAALILPPVTFLIAIPLSGGVQPLFLARWALPKFGLSENTVNMIRIASCAGLAGAWKAFSACNNALGQSFHYIGVREKSKITSAGPYSVVRHPLYSSALAQQLILSLMFWNYIPLAASAICAAAFAVKIPIEEKLIESDPEVGPEYAEYKKKVTYRLIPKVW